MGIDADIEGLLPERITRAGHTEQTELVEQAMKGTKKEKESAKNRLKRIKFEAFKAEAKPGTDDFAEFYRVTAIINKGPFPDS